MPLLLISLLYTFFSSLISREWEAAVDLHFPQNCKVCNHKKGGTWCGPSSFDLLIFAHQGTPLRELLFFPCAAAVEIVFSSSFPNVGYSTGNIYIITRHYPEDIFRHSLNCNFCPTLSTFFLTFIKKSRVLVFEMFTKNKLGIFFKIIIIFKKDILLHSQRDASQLKLQILVNSCSAQDECRLVSEVLWGLRNLFSWGEGMFICLKTQA